MANENAAVIGKTKRSTDNMIDDAIAQQNGWMTRRRNFTRRFLKSLNVFSKKEEQTVVVVEKKQQKKDDEQENKRSVLREYWFPILCAFIVLLIAIWVAFVRTTRTQSIVVLNNTATAQTETPRKVRKRAPVPTDIPTFDIVRIRRDGMLVVAGRWLPNKSISIKLNGKIVATEQTNDGGEFSYAPKQGLKPGNYTLSLVGADNGKLSSDNVFLYVSEAGHKNSISLLMTPKGSKILQAPRMLTDSDLAVSKIDYLDTGRVVVTGTALPRLRVSLAMDDKYIGFARVSDYRNYGVGADIGEMKAGEKHELVVRLHDVNGRTIAEKKHEFVMPEMTGDNDTFYTVRRGDCLWVIARNFLRRGVLFSIIAERNAIENPDLIFPKQLLQIPTKK